MSLKFKPKSELLSRSRKRSKKSLNKEELIKLNAIKKQRKDFLKEIGLVGKKIDKEINISRYKRYKERIASYNIREKKIQEFQKRMVEKTYKEGLLHLFALNYIEKIIKDSPNKALRKRIEKDIKDNYFEIVYSGEWTRSGFLPNERSKQSDKFYNKYKHLHDIFYQSKKGNYYQKFDKRLLEILFKKYPFLKNIKMNDRKEQKKFETEFLKLFNKFKEIRQDIVEPNNPNNKALVKSEKILKTIGNESFKLKPIIWSERLDRLFKERYGTTLTEVYKHFDKEFQNKSFDLYNKPLIITNEILNKSLNKNTLIVLPLSGSFFSYYLTRGIVSEIKRLNLNKKELNVTTISTHSFKSENIRPYGPRDVKEAPDIVSGQITNILRKNPNIENVMMLDYISFGFQREYIKHYFKKQKEVSFDVGNVWFEHQKINTNLGEIEPLNVVSKRVDTNTRGQTGYINPMNYSEKKREIIREMLEVSGRIFLRAEAKIRGLI